MLKRNVSNGMLRATQQTASLAFFTKGRVDIDGRAYRNRPVSMKTFSIGRACQRTATWSQGLIIVNPIKLFI